MPDNSMAALLEAVLFACGEPIEISRLAAGLNLEKAAVREQLDAYAARLKRSDRGIELLFLGESVQLCSKKCFEDRIAAVVSARKNTPLSGAAMETLAIIAYNQPVTKSFVEQVRGVDCSGVIGSLTLKGLIEERGRLELPGRPLLYGTTDAFLRCLNIRSLADLPPLPKNEEAAEQEAPVDGGAEA